jgi:hypothetical protein
MLQVEFLVVFFDLQVEGLVVVEVLLWECGIAPQLEVLMQVEKAVVEGS